MLVDNYYFQDKYESSLAWPDLFLTLSVITCSISAQPKRVWSGLYRQVVLTPPCQPEVLIH